ncbi:MAG: hypothetical protein M3142_11660 [Bacteroidota bacterium]|nr:hypothetical protein [Bacteroidota bacterium]
MEKDTTNRKDGITEIYFVGTGDIQLAYNNDKNSKGIAANTGLGVLFWRIWKTGLELQLDAKVNVASTVDTISALMQNNVITDNRLFGRYVLVPAGSGQATSINSLWYFDRGIISLAKWDSLSTREKLKYQIDGFEVSASASNQIWAARTKDSTGIERTSKSTNVSVLYLRTGIFHEFVPQELRRQKGYSIRFGTNLIFRSIQGDIGRHTSEVEQLRKQFLLSKSTVHVGGELLLALRLKNIRAEASLPIIYARKNQSIPGLSGAQFITSISFVGGFPLNISSSR